MSSLTGDWRRLADRVYARRDELGMTQDEVRAAGGPSTATIRNIEGALQSSYKPRVLSSLERALKWAPGSVQTILAGGEPTPREDARDTEAAESGRSPTIEELAADLARVKAQNAELRQRFEEYLRQHGRHDEPEHRDEAGHERRDAG